MMRVWNCVFCWPESNKGHVAGSERHGKFYSIPITKILPFGEFKTNPCVFWVVIHTDGNVLAQALCLAFEQIGAMLII